MSNTRVDDRLWGLNGRYQLPSMFTRVLSVSCRTDPPVCLSSFSACSNLKNIPASLQLFDKHLELQQILNKFCIPLIFGVFFFRTPLTSANDFTSTKSRIIQLCLELTSTVQKVSDAQSEICVVWSMKSRERRSWTEPHLGLCLFSSFDDDHDQIVSVYMFSELWWWISLRFLI